MTDVDEKEIQKTIDEIRKNAEEFKIEKVYPSEGFSFSNTRLRLIFVILGAVIVLVTSVLLILKSGGQKVKIKAPPGQQVIYPKDGPPRLAPK